MATGHVACGRRASTATTAAGAATSGRQQQRRTSNGPVAHQRTKAGLERQWARRTCAGRGRADAILGRCVQAVSQRRVMADAEERDHGGVFSTTCGTVCWLRPILVALWAPQMYRVATGTCTLVLPFSHGLNEDVRHLAPEGSTGRWSHWFDRLDDEALEVVENYSYSLLPQARQLLYPELGAGSQIVDRTVPASFRQLRERYLPPTRKYQSYYRNEASRLTLSEFKGGDGVVNLDVPELSLRNFGIEWVDAVLLPDRLGALMVSLTIPKNVSCSDLTASIRCLKKVEYRRRLEIDLPNLSINNGQPATWREHTDGWLQEFRASTGESTRRLDEISYDRIFATNWRVALSAAIVVDSSQSDSDLFEHPLEWAAFALAAGHAIAETGSRPTVTLLKELRESATLQHWNDTRLLFHYDNLVQIVDASDSGYVTRQHENFAHQFLDIFLLAAAQRHALDVFSADLSQRAGSIDEVATEHAEFNRGLLRFNQKLFSIDVSATPIGRPLYGMLRERLQLQHALEVLERDSERVTQFIDSKIAEAQGKSTGRIEALISLATLVGLPAGLFVTLFQPRLANVGLFKRLTPASAWLALAVLVIATFAVWLAMRLTRAKVDDSL